VVSVTILCSVTGAAAAQYGDNPIMKWRWILLFTYSVSVSLLYIHVIPLMITRRSEQVLGGMAITIVYLFVHPVIWMSVRMVFRIFMRHIGEMVIPTTLVILIRILTINVFSMRYSAAVNVTVFISLLVCIFRRCELYKTKRFLSTTTAGRKPDLMQTCFLLWPLLYFSLWGRFLLLQVSNLCSMGLPCMPCHNCCSIKIRYMNHRINESRGRPTCSCLNTFS
jgi:hypothetical protein